MRAFLFLATCIACQNFAFGQNPTETPPSEQSDLVEPWFQVGLDVGIGRSTATWQIDSRYGQADVLNPTAGFQLGLSALTKRFDSRSVLFGLHYIRRGNDTDIPATIENLEGSLINQGLDVTLYNAFGTAIQRTDWLELQLGARAWLGEAFFLQGFVVSGLLLGGSKESNYRYDARIENPYTGYDEIASIRVEDEASIVPVGGVLSAQQYDDLQEEYGANVVVARKHIFGGGVEFGGAIGSTEVVLSYRWSVTNLYPELDEVDFGQVEDDIVGSQQFLSIRLCHRPKTWPSLLPAKNGAL
jgi:hypothetical protein